MRRIGALAFAMLLAFAVLTAIGATPRSTGWAHIAKAPCDHPSISGSSSLLIVACPNGQVWEYLR